jgi:hypothetical protein
MMRIWGFRRRRLLLLAMIRHFLAILLLRRIAGALLRGIVQDTGVL